jgi:hypothetical protein
MPAGSKSESRWADLPSLVRFPLFPLFVCFFFLFSFVLARFFQFFFKRFPRKDVWDLTGLSDFQTDFWERRDQLGSLFLLFFPLSTNVLTFQGTFRDWEDT